MNRRFGAWIGVLIFLLLQGCGGPNQQVTPQATVRPSTIIPPVTNHAAAAALPPPALAPPRLSKTERDPERLLHMNRRTISGLLGKPEFVRREATARVWQYRIARCVLDLFLYDEATEHRVIHYEFRPAMAGSDTIDDCFEKMLLRGVGTPKS
ncbi:MAG: hypothetical protein O3B74_02150 [Proteobacteria bacterium]|nr:hypothetical protein [Pseudomonadota bacterium]MDA1308097.1 hypothetical protein [Pseudomonadota bacterium]